MNPVVTDYSSYYIEVARLCATSTQAVVRELKTMQGPRSKFSSGGAKEEYVKENFGGGGAGGSMLVDFYTISLK